MSLKFIVYIFCILSPALASASVKYRLELRDEKSGHRDFIMELSSESDAEGIRSLEYFIGKGVSVDSFGNPEIGHAIGRIQQTTTTNEHHWGFQFVAGSLFFTENSKEVCDASLKWIEDNFDDWMKENKAEWCPWRTRWWIRKIIKNGQLIWQRQLK